MEKKGTYQSLITNKLPGEPEEGLLKVVVRLSRNVVVLEILLAMESNRLCLNFALLDVNFVATEHDRNRFANAHNVA